MVLMEEIEDRITEIDQIQELKDWLLRRVGDDDDIVVDQMQEEYAEEFDKIEATLDNPIKGSEEYLKNQEFLRTTIKEHKIKESNFSSSDTVKFDGVRKCKYGGTVDTNGLPFGEGNILYSNKDSFVGKFNHSVLDREGKLLRAEENCLYTEGTWKNGLMEGEMTIHTLCGGFIEGYFHHGVPHGFQREFGSTDMALMGRRTILFVGRYYKGIRRGFCWKGCLGGGFLTGFVDPQTGDYTGDDFTFIYPDFRQAIKGSFKDGNLVSGRMCELIGNTLEKGIRIPIFSKSHGVEYIFDNPSLRCIGLNPHLRDPWEEDYVYVEKSLLPQGGEGLFAKIDIKQKTVFCLYNGIRIKTTTSAYQKLGHSDYRIRLNADVDLDIPHDMISIENYQATLGHKINHSFIPNAEWTLFEHPRFGIIRALRARENISKDQEVLVNYQMNLSDSPEWYRVLWIKHQRSKSKGADDAFIARIMDRYYENSGKMIPLPKSEELNVPEPRGIQELDEIIEEENEEKLAKSELDASTVKKVKKLFGVNQEEEGEDNDEPRFQEIHDFKA